ncbi:MAG: sensor domain-containing diguanylate cyclase [Nitrospirae bacterium]|nr:MAG: sensor domain-containing diguanylate cyclase [Nitrospirota bacterium]
MSPLYLVFFTVGLLLAVALVLIRKREKVINDKTSGFLKTIRELNILNELSASLHTALDKESIFEQIVNKSKELLRAEKAAILLIDKYKRVTDFYTSLGTSSNECKCSVQGTIKKVIDDMATLRTRDITKHPNFASFPEAHPEIKSVLMVPLLLRGEPIGLICVTDKLDGDEFTSEDEDMLLNLAFHSALAIEKVKLHEEVLKIAATDGLTGLYNHRTFQEKLKEELERARRFKHKVALVMFDIDHFKGFNDTYGHLKGDEILQRVACIMTDNIRTIDFAARYGGEEFALILPEVSYDGAMVVAERIRKKVEEHELSINGEAVSVTISGGIAIYPDDATTQEELLERADKALYLSKRTGRNRISTYHE